MKQQRLKRRQARQLRDFYAQYARFFADSFEYCEEHLNLIHRQHKQFFGA
jgi:hypothetical protein